MTTTSATTQRAFAAWWEDVDRWSVGSLRRASWHWPSSAIKKLANALERRNDRVDKGTFDLQPEHFVSLRFTGEVEQRELHGKEDFKGALFFARAGDILYSKIDVRNGAIGIIPDAIPVATVTSEFPVYRIREGVALSQYIQLVFRTDHFKRLINAMVSGASGRKRVQPDDLEQVEIPLPSLTEQATIVARWHKAQDEIASARGRVGKRIAAIDARFFADLGLRSPEQLAMPRAFAVFWEDFRRWGVRFNQLSQGGADITQGKYPVVELDSILDLVQYGTSEKANSTGKGVPVLRIGNIKNRALDVTDLKHIPLPAKALTGLLLQDGDVLIIRTSGSRDLVGTCAVFRGEGDYIFASYLIRLRFDITRVVPEFVSWFLNSLLGRQQVDAVSRQIMQNNINSEELRGLQIPLPPLAVQHKIMERVASGRAEIARERETAEKQSKAIDAEIEALILGTKSVKDAAGE